MFVWKERFIIVLIDTDSRSCHPLVPLLGWCIGCGQRPGWSAHSRQAPARRWGVTELPKGRRARSGRGSPGLGGSPVPPPQPGSRPAQRPSGKFVVMRRVRRQAGQPFCRPGSGLGLSQVTRVRHSPTIVGQVQGQGGTPAHGWGSTGSVGRQGRCAAEGPGLGWKGAPDPSAGLVAGRPGVAGQGRSGLQVPQGPEGKGQLDGEAQRLLVQEEGPALLSACWKQDSSGGTVQVGWRKNSTEVEQMD